MISTINYIRTESDKFAIANGCFFDEAKAEAAILWLEETFNVKLYEWQRDLFWMYFGWRNKDSSYRFTKVTAFIPKKNGKTTAIAYLLAFKLFELKNCKIYSVAFCAKQSKVLMDELITTFKNAPKIKPLMKPRTGNIAAFSSPFRRDVTNKSRNNVYYALADNVSGSDGIIPDVLVFDEIHRMKNQLIDVVDGSTSNNPNALKVIISTAGSGDKTHRSWNRYSYTKSVLNGDVIDTQLLPVIYECPNADGLKGTDIYDLDLLVACNPVLQECADKREQAAKELAEAKQLRNDAYWRRFRLGQWLSTDGDEYINSAIWNEAEVPAMSDDSLAGCDCFAGFDRTGGAWDLSALSLQFVLDDGRIYERHYCFMADDRIAEVGERDDKDYSRYVKPDGSGELIIYPASAVTDDWLYEWMKAELKKFKVKKIGADPSFAANVLERLQADGYDVAAVQQSNNKLLTPVITDYLDRVRQKRLAHPKNDLASWQLSCARCRTTAKDTLKIVKAGTNVRGSGGTGHIDSVDASLNALAVLREAELKKKTQTEVGRVYAEA